MKAVLKNQDYFLVDPVTQKEVETINARKVFDLMITMAWKYGDPGMLFIDTINKYNPTPILGNFETTDPCGDQPLLPYGGVPYGAINLSNFVEKKKINWSKLKAVIPIAVRFLDNCIDVTTFPITTFKKNVTGLRNIGLGILGFADLLYLLEVSYTGREAISLAQKLMEFIQTQAQETSRKIAEEKGNFKLYPKSIFAKKRIRRRNASLTTISPCGARGILADTTGGIEPNFALGYYRRTVASGEILHINPVFEEVAKKRGFHSTDLMRKIAAASSLNDVPEIPDDVKKIFVTAHDIPPECHIRIQATFQKYVDNAISKTVNFPYSATLKDVERVCLLAYKLGCKGITTYRDGSRDDQIIVTQ
jgi:ribonucleoside-diphosphate reductase alpha chain